jgi:hypothetical protein
VKERVHDPEAMPASHVTFADDSQASDTAQEPIKSPPAKDQAIMLTILPNVFDGHTTCIQFDHPADSMPGIYKLSGDDDLVKLICEEATTQGVPPEGMTSPMHEVTIPIAEKASLGIPPEAAHYAFLYPIRGLEGNETLGDDAASFGFLYGGFLYFDSNKSFLQFNALGLTAPEKGDVSITLMGPFEGEKAFVERLEARRRLVDVTLQALQEQGFCKFGWVTPNESLEDGPLGIERYQHGAFAYQMESAPYVQYYVVTPQRKDVVMEDLTRTDSNASKMGNAIYKIRKTLNLESISGRFGRRNAPKLYRQLSMLQTVAKGDDADDGYESEDEDYFSDEWLNQQLVAARRKLDEADSKSRAKDLAEQLNKAGLDNVDDLISAACKLSDGTDSTADKVSGPDQRRVRQLMKTKKEASGAASELCKVRLKLEHTESKRLCKLLEYLIRVAADHWILQRDAERRAREAYIRVVTKDALDEPMCGCFPQLTKWCQLAFLVFFYVFGNLIPNLPWCLLPLMTERLRKNFERPTLLSYSNDERRPILLYCLDLADVLEPLGYIINAVGILIALHVAGAGYVAQCPNVRWANVQICAAEIAYLGWALGMTLLHSIDKVHEIFIAKRPSSQLSAWLLQIFAVEVPRAMLDSKSSGQLQEIDTWLFVVISLLVGYTAYFLGNWFLYPDEVVRCEPRYMRTNASDPDPTSRCPPPYYFPLVNDPSTCCRFVDESFEYDVLIARLGGAAVSAYAFVRVLARLFFYIDPIAKDATTRSRRDTDERLVDSAVMTGRMSPRIPHSPRIVQLAVTGMSRSVSKLTRPRSTSRRDVQRSPLESHDLERGSSSCNANI